jgi:hypothetical protein
MSEDRSGENRSREDRCWPCTVANSVVGLVVAWVPLVASLVRGSPELVAGTLVWGVLVTGYTGYRLVDLGYLPGAETAAKLTGLHERIGPGSNSEHTRRDEE